MKRRDFLAVSGAAALAWPTRVGAQSLSRKPIIGLLYLGNHEPSNGQLRAAMSRLGYRDGETVQYDLRVADGSEKRLAEMAADLVARNVDVIVAATTPAVIAAKAATTAIPIVMAEAADPVFSGLVASLSRPGGNITGVDVAVPAMAGSLLGLLHEAIPNATRFGLLLNASDPIHRRLIESAENANRVVSVDLRVFPVSASSAMEAVFDQMSAQKIEAAIVQPTLPRKEAIDFAARRRIPTCCPVFGYAHLGGFMSYSASAVDLFTVAAGAVDQILKGAKPADIPVRQPSQFDLVLNLKTARSLGLEVPALLLAEATDLIE